MPRNIGRSTCYDACYDLKTVFAECKAVGHISHVPSLRACDLCLEQNRMCVRRVVMVLCSDCETENKNAFEILNEKLENGTIDPTWNFCVFCLIVHMLVRV